jgi:hypothetical protein
MALTVDWANDGLDNNGDGVIDGPEELDFYTVYGIARCNDVVRYAETVTGAKDVSVWNNAIFAGAGHVSGACQGNMSIHGSLHILGNNLPDGAVALEFKGASGMSNSYAKGAGPALDNDLLVSVPPLPLTWVNGELVETLEAEVRVKNGVISSASIGESNQDGDSVKEQVDGVYTNDGFIGGTGDVHSDNGTDQPYDMGDKVELPMLHDPWRWPNTIPCEEQDAMFVQEPGGTELGPDGNPYTYEQMYSQLSDGAPFVGDVNIALGGAPVYINLSQPGNNNPALRVKPNPGACVKGDDYIYFNGSVLEIGGQFEMLGDLTVTGASGKGSDPLYYTGRGALMVHGDATMDSDVRSCNNGDPNNVVRSYPENNILALICTDNLTLGTKAQAFQLGAFYAAGTVTSPKQTIVMGTFVSEYFDMGNQVPDIYEVPSLPKYLPMGMIANCANRIFYNVYWRELEPPAPEESGGV